MSSRLNQIATLSNFIDTLNRVNYKGMFQNEIRDAVGIATKLVEGITSEGGQNTIVEKVPGTYIQDIAVNLPSEHQIGDMVDLEFRNSKDIKGCFVKGVHFTNDHVYYDIDVPFNYDKFVTMYDVDSIVVVKPIHKR